MKAALKWGVIIILLTIILAVAVSFKGSSVSQTIYGDTDGNGSQEKYVLRNQQLQVFEDNRLIWNTPRDWKIKQIKLADADNNKQTEILLVIWKNGSFGKSKPFWIKGQDNNYTCHLFLYRLLSGKMKEVWCSSALEYPIINLDVKDSNADGLNELNVLQGPRAGFAYALRQYVNQQETKWLWSDWGFKRID